MPCKEAIFVVLALKHRFESLFSNYSLPSDKPRASPIFINNTSHEILIQRNRVQLQRQRLICFIASICLVAGLILHAVSAP